MKKMKVFGGYKLNKHWAAAVQQGAEWFESMSLQVRLLQAQGAKPGITSIGGKYVEIRECSKRAKSSV